MEGENIEGGGGSLRGIIEGPLYSRQAKLPHHRTSPRGLWGTPGDSGEPLLGFRGNLKLRASGGPQVPVAPSPLPSPSPLPGGPGEGAGDRTPPLGPVPCPSLSQWQRR